MIEKIGVLCQDRNSFGFLLGIARRLKCEAELIEPTTGSLSKSTLMSRRQGRLAAADLQRKRVDLILRFTDADGKPWQLIRRHEEQVFPSEFNSIVVCGVAVDNVEQWLALDLAYIQSQLQLDDLTSSTPEQRTAIIKRAIPKHRRPDEPVSEVAARLVADAPSAVFQRWLDNDALRRFYQDCRAAAIQSGCEVPNELDE